MFIKVAIVVKIDSTLFLFFLVSVRFHAWTGETNLVIKLESC